MRTPHVMGLSDQDSVAMMEAFAAQHSPEDVAQPHQIDRPTPEILAFALANRVQIESMCNPKIRPEMHTHQYRGHLGLQRLIDKNTHQEMEHHGYRWNQEIYQFQGATAEIYQEIRRAVIDAIVAGAKEYFATCSVLRMMPRREKGDLLPLIETHFPLAERQTSPSNDIMTKQSQPEKEQPAAA
jgi:hypothetical protein